MSEHFDNIIVKGRMPNDLSVQEGAKIMDDIVDYLCSEEMHEKALTSAQYVNLIALFSEIWWCAETSIGRMMKETLHLVYMRKQLKDTPAIERWMEFVNKLVEQLQRRSAHKDWKQDRMVPDYGKAVADVKGAKG